MVKPGQRWKRDKIVVEVLRTDENFVYVRIIQAPMYGSNYSVSNTPYFSKYKFDSKLTNNPYHEENVHFEYMVGQDAPT